MLTAATVLRVQECSKEQLFGEAQDTLGKKLGACPGDEEERGGGVGGRARACAVQKQKPGRKRLLCVVSGPISLGCYSDVLRLYGDFWTEDEGFFAATVTPFVDVLLKIAQMSLQKSLIFLPHTLSLSHRHPRQKPSHGHSRPSPTQHPFHAGTPSRMPSEASQPPLMRSHVSTHLAAQHASEGLLRGFPEVFQSSLQNLSHPLCRNGSRGVPAAKKGGF